MLMILNAQRDAVNTSSQISLLVKYNTMSLMDMIICNVSSL